MLRNDRTWRDLFSPRQLLCHGTSVEVFREMLEEDREAGELTANSRKRSIRVLGVGAERYCSQLQLANDPIWHSLPRQVMANTFDRSTISPSSGPTPKWRP